MSSVARIVLNLVRSPDGAIVAHRSSNVNFHYCHLECQSFKLKIGLGYELVKEAHKIIS
jgi:hypothetical protein